MSNEENHIHQLQCHDLGKSGEGVCDQDGYKIFVEGALPQETISCKILERKKNYAKGVLLDVIKPSKDRVKPVCPYFEKCGGCQIMHLDYQAQLKIKKESIAKNFVKIAGFQPVSIEDVAASPHEIGYRNKIQMPAVYSKGEVKIGLYQKRSHEVIDIPFCYLHNQVGQRVFESLRSIVKESGITFYDEKSGRGELRHILIRTSKLEEKCLVLLIAAKKPSEELKKAALALGKLDEVKGVAIGKNERRSNFVLPQKVIPICGDIFLEEEILGTKARLSPLSFFQVNLEMAEKMYAKALEFGKVEDGMHVIDAYSGVGVFSTLLAKMGAKVTAIEVVKDAVDDAKANAEANGLVIDAVCGKVEDVIEEYPKAEVVYLNPPRKGCAPEVIASVIKKSPQRIVYTSCDPATLARDAKLFYEGGYKHVELSPFDLFAQTMHVETIALFLK